MSWPAISKLAEQVLSGETKATDLVEQSLQTIDRQKDFAAIIATTAERARQRARAIDAQVASGLNPGRLAGVPFIAKDNFLTFGSQTTAASNMLKGFNAPYQATVIEKLEAEGAICVAKANLDAFAHGSSTENSDYMTTKNPHNRAYVPGGSSGGSAAAVVLRMAPFALGTDTGGSIRLPASFCGAVGYKPTYGLVSRSGVVAMASSTDVVGPLTMNVADAATVLEVISGPDQLDSTTIERDKQAYTKLDIDLKDQTFGVVKEYMADLSPDIKAPITKNIEKLKQAGATVKEVSLPSLPLALACYYIICPAEVSSNLSRYDGQHFGFSAPANNSLEASYRQTRSQGFGNEAKRRIMLGTYVLSSGYYDAYYNKAQQLRTKLISEFTAAFKQYDFLVGPTAPSSAFKIGEHSKDPLRMLQTDIMTVATNLVGIPAISIQSGSSNGLPVGLQLMANQKQDRQLLAAAKAIEGVIHE